MVWVTSSESSDLNTILLYGHGDTVPLQEGQWFEGIIPNELKIIDEKIYGRGVADNKVLLADEFTPDGCRLWDSETLKKMDKDRFRQGLGDVVESYHQVADRLGMNIKLD